MNEKFLSNHRFVFESTWAIGKGDAIDKESLDLTAVRSEGKIGGTPGYCSPEQWFMFNKDDIDERSDIYSLGIIFYEMLTRRRPAPYDTNDPFTAQQQLGPSLSIMSKQKRVDPPSKFNPSIASQLDNCILKMIQVDPNKRQNSVWDLMVEFDMMR